MPRAEVKIGAQFGRLIVIGLADSDAGGNQRVIVKCSCKTEKTVRLSNLTFESYVDKNGKVRNPYRSCGCESKRAHTKFWELRAWRLGAQSRQKIWKEYQKGHSHEVLARRYRLPPGVILAAIRIQNRKHPAKLSPAIPKWTKASREWDESHGGDLPY
jgi:hypothetical protein